MGSTRYITSMGELSRKDNSLCFRKNGKNVYIPVENTKETVEFLYGKYIKENYSEKRISKLTKY